MGRKRSHNPNIPKHINQKLLPGNCYWDNTGTGRWYTKVIDENGKRRGHTVANSKATLADLHRAIEDLHTGGTNKDTFTWLSDKYFENADYRELSPKTREEYARYLTKLYDIKVRGGKSVPEVPLSQWNSFAVQHIVDKIVETRGPTVAKRTHSFIQLVFNWGKYRNYCQSNPAAGVKLPKLRPKQRLPDMDTYNALLAFARNNGTYGQKSESSCAHYWWIVMEIAYLCRMRGVEVRSMTDADVLDDGLYVHRSKGSRDNIVAWCPRLFDVVEQAQKIRKDIWDSNTRSIPIRAERRTLIVNTLGDPIKAFNWDRFIKSAIDAGVIRLEDRFSPHDLKRLGVTHTAGTRHDKQEASGHKSEQMMDVYDKSVPIVRAAGEE